MANYKSYPRPLRHRLTREDLSWKPQREAKELQIGQTAYVVCQALLVDSSGKCWIAGTYPMLPSKRGLMKLKRRKDGLHLWPVRGFPYRHRTEADLPLAEPTYQPVTLHHSRLFRRA